MKHILFLFASFFVLLQYSVGQTTELRPDPPAIISVTVDPETGYVIITWLPSPTPALVNYYYVGQKQKEVVSTIKEISSEIYPPQYSYTITSPDAQSASESYTVKAINDLGGDDRYDSFYDTPHNTIFLEAAFDSCHATIDLNWNNYAAWEGSIDRIEIRRRIDANIYVTLATLPEGTTSYELVNPDISQTYELFIETIHNDGVRSSRSNLRSVDTWMTAVPSFINADYATISAGSGIDLSFTIGGNSALSSYRLLRSNSYEGPYTAIDSFNVDDNRLTYTDPVNYLGSVFYYKLEVLNNCGLGAIESNRANNMILNGTLSDLNALLEWNEYRDWNGNVAQYRIVRTTGRENPLIDTIGSTATTFFNDDISDLVNYLDPAEGIVCYTVVADENPNTYGIQGHSESNRRCFSVNPGIRIPNAFIPNDQEPENQVFSPVFSFLPEHYEMIIYNRLGLKIWEGSVPWDGRVNGKYVPEGVYVYYIRVFNYSAEIQEYKGRVTVAYR